MERTHATATIQFAEFSPDGKKLLIRASESVWLWNAASAREIHKFEGSFIDARVLAFSPNGKQLLTAFDDKPIQLWDAESGNAIGEFGTASESTVALVFSPDGRQALSCNRDRVALLWEVASRNAIHKLPVAD